MCDKIMVDKIGVRLDLPDAVCLYCAAKGRCQVSKTKRHFMFGCNHRFNFASCSQLALSLAAVSAAAWLLQLPHMILLGG